MSSLLGFGILAIVLGLVLSRTPAGRRWRARSGSAAGIEATASPRSAPNEDHDFLLKVCDGSEDELLRRLEAEIKRNPNLDEASLYRRAIRSWFHEKRGGTHGEPGGEGSEGSDTWL